MLNSTKRGRVRPVTLLALLLSVSIAVISLSFLPGVAQQITTTLGTAKGDRSFIAAGTSIPVKYDKAEKILLTPAETYALSLTVTDNIKNSVGRVIIPNGSQIIGEIKPSAQGSRFFSQKIFLPAAKPQEERFDAVSEVVEHLEKIIKGVNPDRIVRGAALGQSASVVLANLTDDRSIERSLLRDGGWEVLAGWLLRGESVELLSIEPRRDLQLTLRSDFTRP